MVKKKTILPILGIGILLIFGMIIAGAIIIPNAGLVEQSIFKTDTVWIPEYTTIRCDVCQGGAENRLFVEDVSVPFFSFFDVETEQYICPDNFYRGCTYTFTGNGLYRKCGINEECEAGILSSSVILSSGTIIDLTPAEQVNIRVGAGSNVEVRRSGNPYCLWIEHPDGRKDADTQACETSELIKQPLVIPKEFEETRTIGVERGIDHVVFAWAEKRDLRDMVEEGLLYRLGGQIKVCPIKTAENGAQYADTLNCQSTSKYVCIPSELTACVGGLKVVEQKTGSECAGSGLIGLEEISGEQCEITCENNVRTIGECKEIIEFAPGVPERPEVPSVPTDCPAGTIFVKERTSECSFLCAVGLADTKIIEKNFCKQELDLTPIIIVSLMILGGILITIVGVVLIRSLGGKKPPLSNGMQGGRVFIIR